MCGDLVASLDMIQLRAAEKLLVRAELVVARWAPPAGRSDLQPHVRTAWRSRAGTRTPLTPIQV